MLLAQHNIFYTAPTFVLQKLSFLLCLHEYDNAYAMLTKRIVELTLHNIIVVYYFDTTAYWLGSCCGYQLKSDDTSRSLVVIREMMYMMRSC